MTSDKHNIREALLAMGYKEMPEGKWLKPVGFQLLVYYQDKKLIANWFLGANDQILIWEKRDINVENDPLIQLKEFEAFTRLDVTINFKSTLHLPVIDL